MKKKICFVFAMLFGALAIVGCQPMPPRPWYTPCSNGIWGLQFFSSGGVIREDIVGLVRLLDAERVIDERGFLVIPNEIDGRRVHGIGFFRPIMFVDEIAFFVGDEDIVRVVVPATDYLFSVNEGFFLNFPAKYIEFLGACGSVQRAILDISRHNYHIAIIVPDGSKKHLLSIVPEWGLERLTVIEKSEIDYIG